MAATDHNQPFLHRPVMVGEIVAEVLEIPSGTFLDATVGGGGHAAAVLEARDDLTIVGLDRDRVALGAAAARLADHASRVELRHARFDQLALVLDEVDVAALSGFLFDLGVSSPQLDQADRGFSYRHDGPLDMRMDRDEPTTADQVVNGYDQRELAGVLRRWADERFADRIAAAIVAARPLATTGQLAEVVTAAIPAAARRTGGHPATRTFQAIRIEVNAELSVLRPALEAALDRLGPRGRGLVLTYHSGEDRIVKDAFRRRTESSDPPGLPVAVQAPGFRVVRPASRRPSAAEQADNPRSGSARLRVVERLAA